MVHENTTHTFNILRKLVTHEVAGNRTFWRKIRPTRQQQIFHTMVTLK